MKKLCLILTILVILLLCACGKAATSVDESDQPTTDSEETHEVKDRNSESYEYLAKGYEYLQDEDYDSAINCFAIAAEEGNSNAMYELGNIYEFGSDAVEPDYQKAMEWHLKAAEAGNSDSMGIVASFYMKGIGTEQDNQKATEWFLKAAEAGNNGAMMQVGFMYLSGVGVDKDTEKGEEWLEKAAGQFGTNYSYTMKNIADAYYFGQNDYGPDIEQDYSKAAEWYQKAAQANDARAMEMLSVMCFYGRGMEKDSAKAMEWYKKVVDIKGKEIAGDDISSLFNRGVVESDYLEQAYMVSVDN